MTTITINPRTKAGKTLLEIASLLAISNKGVSIEKDVTPKQRTLINRLKRIKNDVDNGNMKRFRPINEVLNEI